jgi:sugar lactone lactonase YvrE
MGAAASFYSPAGVASDSSGNIYVADQVNQTIRVITPAGLVTTLAGTPGVVGSTNGTGSAALFNSPNQVAVDGSGNLYVADTGNQVIRMITPGGVVSTYAGRMGVSGSADSPGARFNTPTGVAVYQPVVPGPVTLFVADTGNDTIRKIDPLGNVTTFAGTAGVTGAVDAAGAAARFYLPASLTVDSATGTIYVADSFNNTIRRISSAGVVSTLVGAAGVYGSADGTGTSATFADPTAVSLDAVAANLYVADRLNQTIRQVTIATRTVTTLAGSVGTIGWADGTGSAASFANPIGLANDPSGNVYVADSSNNMIRRITTPGGVVSTFAGSIGGRGYQDGTGGAARFNNPQFVATDAAGNTYAVDHNTNVVRQISASGVVTTIAGTAGRAGFRDSPGALFNAPYGVAVDSTGNVYVADTSNNAIRKITMPAGTVTTLAGGNFGSADGTGSAAAFESPTGLAADTAGNLYVADFGNNEIRMVTPAGVVTTIAGKAGHAGSADGTGAAARFWGPRGIAADAVGNLYIADRNNHTIRLITSGGVVTTLAGSPGSAGFRDGSGGTARFNWPIGPAVDASGNVYVADYNNHAIRMITSGGAVTTVVGAPPGAPLSFSVALGPLPGSLDGPASVAVAPGLPLRLIIAEAVENSILVATFP